MCDQKECLRNKWMSYSFWWAKYKSRTIGVSTPKTIHIHIIHLLNSFFCVIMDQKWHSSFLHINIGLNNWFTCFRLFSQLIFEKIYICRADHLYTNYYTFYKWCKLEMSMVFVSKSRLSFKGCCGSMKYMCLLDSANH